jgi:hypothetical protein
MHHCHQSGGTPFACFAHNLNAAAEPRRLDDPANKPFLDSIARGDCPKELEPSDRSIAVNVNLIRVEKDYVAPPKPRYTAFSGTGRLLSGSQTCSCAGTAFLSVNQAASCTCKVAYMHQWEEYYMSGPSLHLLAEDYWKLHS